MKTLRPSNPLRTPNTPVRKTGIPDSPLEAAKRKNGVVGYRAGGRAAPAGRDR